MSVWSMTCSGWSRERTARLFFVPRGSLWDEHTGTISISSLRHQCSLFSRASDQPGDSQFPWWADSPWLPVVPRMSPQQGGLSILLLPTVHHSQGLPSRWLALSVHLRPSRTCPTCLLGLISHTLFCSISTRSCWKHCPPSWRTFPTVFCLLCLLHLEGDFYPTVRLHGHILFTRSSPLQPQALCTHCSLYWEASSSTFCWAGCYSFLLSTLRHLPWTFYRLLCSIYWWAQLCINFLFS